ncbi:nucleoside phosphorylase [Sungkyunkwania multivorans]|uniref:Uridine phosphorylase n=1 Tax=Sungkyunkwania multivorans TaxID=1173618 RepID=A0ABW3CZX2_9FLAO
MRIAESELIVNPDGSIYHLNLLPSDIADTVIFVGDPGRVSMVSKYFDTIEVKKEKREFVTHTGVFNGKRLSVISTGIGPDNIDIAMNELDALVNIDLHKREVKKEHTALNIIRIGTSGGTIEALGVDSFLLSEYAIGFDGLLHYYQSEHVQEKAMQEAFIEHTDWYKEHATPYVVKYDKKLGDKLISEKVHLGFTGTNIGFYGPQGRTLRIPVQDEGFHEKLASFEYQGKRITNLEMETSTIYGMAALLGHSACSMNCIIANRASGTFSEDYQKSVDKLIKYTLERLTSWL